MASMNTGGGKEKNGERTRKFFNDDLMDGFFNGSFYNFFPNTIRADIKENADGFLLEAELPGVRKEQIEIYYEKDVLTVIARQSANQSDDRERYVRRERCSGEMRRSFTLENILEDQIQAEYREGILRIYLPKDKNIADKRKNIRIL